MEYYWSIFVLHFAYRKVHHQALTCVNTNILDIFVLHFAYRKVHHQALTCVNTNILAIFVFEDGTDGLSRNVCMKLPLYAALLKIPKERRSHLHCGGSMTTCTQNYIHTKLMIQQLGQN